MYIEIIITFSHLTIHIEMNGIIPLSPTGQTVEQLGKTTNNPY